MVRISMLGGRTRLTSSSIGNPYVKSICVRCSKPACNNEFQGRISDNRVNVLFASISFSISLRYEISETKVYE